MEFERRPDSYKGRKGILSVKASDLVKLLGISKKYWYEGAYYDFDSESFFFKFSHNSFPTHVELTRIVSVKLDKETGKLS